MNVLYHYENIIILLNSSQKWLNYDYKKCEGINFSSRGDICTTPPFPVTMLLNTTQYTCFSSIHKLKDSKWELYSATTHSEIYHEIKNRRRYVQWCGNSQSCRTLSDTSSECPVNLKYKVHVYMRSRTNVMKIGQNVW